MKLAFYDSGIGGLTVLYEALKINPFYDYVYFSDAKNAPYGIKTKEEVKKIVLDVAEFLYNLNIDAIVVACNTATAVAINDLREKYSIPIIGMEPAVKPAVELSQASKKVLVTATPLTLKEEKFQNLVHKLDKDGIVDTLPLPKLVEFAENFIFDTNEVEKYLKDEFCKFNLNEYSTLVLGCTHFPYFHNQFKKILPSHIKIIDGNLGTVNNLFRQIEIKYGKIENFGNGNIEFYISKEKISDKTIFTKYLQVIKNIEKD
ncbi:MAG TPA: glutamate racemase [Ignavibacteriales bacterium]|nr:glutamate racemase [Ignavibacteriales bacterium]